jgi:hypothetical protein
MAQRWNTPTNPTKTRHGSLGKGEFTVHDLENIGDHELVFVTVEFTDSANKPMALPHDK